TGNGGVVKGGSPQPSQLRLQAAFWAHPQRVFKRRLGPHRTQVLHPMAGLERVLRDSRASRSSREVGDATNPVDGNFGAATRHDDVQIFSIHRSDPKRTSASTTAATRFSPSFPKKSIRTNRRARADVVSRWPAVASPGITVQAAGPAPSPKPRPLFCGRSYDG